MPSATKVQTGYLEAVNPLTLASGTASAPIIAFSNHSGTGMFSPSVGALAFSTASHQSALTILANGNVGIGTTNPSIKLSLIGAGDYYSNFNTELDGYISLTNIASNNPNPSFISFKHVNTFSSFSVGNNLGQILYRDNSNSTKAAIAFVKDTTHAALAFNSGNSASFGEADLVIRDTGNIGIGTTNPARKLHISGGAADGGIALDGVASYVDFRFGNLNKAYVGTANLLGTGTSDNFTIWNSANGFLSFGTNSTEKVRIDASGNVGIGTTNPSKVLSVFNSSGDIALFQSSTSYGTVLEIKATGTNGRSFKIQSTASGDFENPGGAFVIDDATSAARRLVIDSSGRILMGVTNWSGSAGNAGGIEIQSANYVAGGQVTERLGSWRATANDNNGTCQVGIDLYRMPRGGGVQSGTEIRFYTGFTYTPQTTAQSMTLDQSGNLGIGATSPLAKLDVRGNILVKNLGNVTGNSSIMIGSSVTDGDLSTTGVSIRTFVESSGSNGYALQLFTQQSYLTGQTEKIRITGSGNVGIGTTNPGAKLDIDGHSQDSILLSAGAYTPAFRLINGVPTAQGGVNGWKINYRPNYAGGVGTGTDKTAIELINSVGSNGNLVLLPSGGNVGVGTTNPGAKLNVYGSGDNVSLFTVQDTTESNVTRSFGIANRVGVNASGYSAYGIYINSSATASAANEQTTYIQLSTTDPSLNGAHGTSSYITLTTPSAQGTYGTGQFDFYIRNSAPYTFPRDPAVPSNYWMSSLMTIKSDGNVGIGSTNPSYPLDVNGNIRSTNQIYSTVATGTAPFVVSSTTKVNNLNCDLFDGYDTPAFFALNYQIITVGGDANTWYPVLFSRAAFPTTIYLRKYVHDYQTWDGVLSFIMMSHTNSWGGDAGWDKIIYHSYSTRQFIGRLTSSPQSNTATVIYLLGGGRNYQASVQPFFWMGATVYLNGVDYEGATYLPITSPDTIATGWEP